MSSPVDIKAVFDAMGAAEEARNQKILVHVYVDIDVQADLSGLVEVATRAQANNARVVGDIYPETGAVLDSDADLALLVARDGARTGALYTQLQSLGVPVAMFARNRDELCHAALDAGHPISEKDVFAPSVHVASKALADTGANSEISLDSATAQDMLSQFGAWVVDVFKEKRLAFAHAFPCVRHPLALESVRATSIQNAGIGVVAIIPGADMPLMTLNQLKMLLEIAAAYGEELSMGRLKEILAVVGGAFACRAAARQVVGIVPGVGWAVKGGIGYAGTLAMGHALIEYFESGANAGVAAKNAADKVKAAPSWMGVQKGNGLVHNAQAAGSAIAEAVGNAANSIVKTAIPTVGELAHSVGEATGFAKEDVIGLVGGALNRIAKRN